VCRERSSIVQNSAGGRVLVLRLVELHLLDGEQLRVRLRARAAVRVDSEQRISPITRGPAYGEQDFATRRGFAISISPSRIT
jgi:hypothetical protein